MKISLNYWKEGFIATWIFGLLAHAYHIFNNQPNHDCIRRLKGNNGTFSSGRWFIDIAEIPSSGYKLPWLIGVLSFCYIGLAVILIFDVLELKHKVSIVLIAAAMITAPAVTAAFSFMYTADSYMLGVLLAVLAVWVTRKYKLGWILGGSLLCISLGIYQAKLSVAVLMVLLIIMKDLLIDKVSFGRMCAQNYRQIFMGLLGTIGYFGVTKIINGAYGTDLSSYQGLNSMGILRPYELRMNMQKALGGFRMFWGIDGFPRMSAYGWLSFSCICLILGITGYIVIKEKIYRKPLCLLSIVGCLLAIPFMCFIILLVSVEVEYTVTMMMGMAFVMVLVIMLLEQLPAKQKKGKVLYIAGLLALCGICCRYIKTANIAYFYLEVSYERSYATCMDLLNRLEDIQTDDREHDLVIGGRYASAGESYLEDLEPYISGVTGDTFLYDDVHYTSMWKYYFGRNFELAAKDVKNEIIQSDMFRNMPPYPQKGCVQLYDNDTIVIKMSE